MKKLLFFILFVFIGANAFSQNFVDSTARWHQYYSWMGFNQTSLCNSQIYFEGDTILENKNYLKMYRYSECTFTQYTTDSIGNSIQIVTVNTDTLFEGFFREYDKKFVFRLNDTTETLLYNFNISDFTSFDSITSVTNCFPSNVSVLTHDTVCIGNEARKSWQISMSQYPSATRLIEGVGPNSGFRASICRNGCPECGYGLTLFTMHGDTLYHGNCNLVSNGINKLEEKTTLIVSNKNKSITIDGIEIKSLALFDLNGKKLMGQTNLSTNFVEIDISKLNPSIYFLHVEAGNTIYKRKVFVNGLD